MDGWLDVAGGTMYGPIDTQSWHLSFDGQRFFSPAPGLVSVVSTAPGVLLGAPTDEELDAAGMLVDEVVPNWEGELVLVPGTVPVALTVRVPTFVNVEGGAIQPGDWLTSSSVPGVAMKATGPGPVVGRALGAYDGTGVPNIEVFIQPGLHAGADTSERVSTLEAQLAAHAATIAALEARLDALAALLGNAS